MPEYLPGDSGLTALAHFVITDGTLDDALLRMAELTQHSRTGAVAEIAGPLRLVLDARRWPVLG